MHIAHCTTSTAPFIPLMWLPFRFNLVDLCRSYSQYRVDPSMPCAFDGHWLWYGDHQRTVCLHVNHRSIQSENTIGYDSFQFMIKLRNIMWVVSVLARLSNCRDANVPFSWCRAILHFQRDNFSGEKSVTLLKMVQNKKAKAQPETSLQITCNDRRY